jgi:hypothetical protein
MKHRRNSCVRTEDFREDKTHEVLVLH